MPELGVPDDVVVTSATLREWPLPVLEGSKDDRGRLLVVGGSAMNPGGVVLAAEAAMRSGAGKLQIATVREVATQVGVAVPEAGVFRLDQDDDGDIAPSAAGQIVELAEQCRTVLIGPGISSPAAACALLEAIVPHLATTVVIDALGMAFLTEHPDGVRHLEGQALVSPNLVELAKTLGADHERAEEDPRSLVVELARRSGAVVAAGAATTWTALPDGRTWRDETGCPGLSTSGSGDVKAGVIAGLTVRGGDLAQAAVWATYAHGRAGERLAAQIGQVGFLARDLVSEIPRVLAELT